MARNYCGNCRGEGEHYSGCQERGFDGSLYEAERDELYRIEFERDENA